MRRWKLAETNYGEVKRRKFEAAVLPLGATEPHNLHLPYGTDTFEADVIGEHICAEADRRGANVLLLPTIPYGTETNMRELPLALNLNPSTLYLVVRDLIDSLVQNGIRKIVLLNSHGGNEMKPLLRELYGAVDAQPVSCAIGSVRRLRASTRRSSPRRKTTPARWRLRWPWPTSPILSPATTKAGRPPTTGACWPLRFEALRAGWVGVTRPWHLLTSNSGSGDPHAATAEKGRRVMDVLVERLAQFLVELSAAEIDESFPFEP